MLRSSGGLRAALAEISSRPTWPDRLAELVAYKERTGDCNVPKAAGPLGRWVARQRELARKNVLTHERRLQLDALGFVWNTNEAAWEVRFAELVAWVEREGRRGSGRRGGACVPIASGDLGVWVAKQRQLMRKGKLSSERIARLNDVGFVWDTAAADWEEKFHALLRWKERNGGDTRVPFNSPGEDGLGWWVATQRQAQRKGKMSDERKKRLDSIGFCWNPTDTPRRGRLLIGRSAPRVTSTAPRRAGTETETPHHSRFPEDSGDMRSGLSLPLMRGPRHTSNKRPFDEAGAAASKRHHSFTGEPSTGAVPGEPNSFSSGSCVFNGYPAYDPAVVRRAASFNPLSADPFTIIQAGHGSGSTTPASESTRTFSGTGGELAGNGNYKVGVGEVQLPPLLFNGQSKPPSLCSVSAPNSGSGAFIFGHPHQGTPEPMLPPVSSIHPAAPQSEDFSWQHAKPLPPGTVGGSDGVSCQQGLRSLRRGALLDIDYRGQEPVPYGGDAEGGQPVSHDRADDREPYAASGTSWSTVPPDETQRDYSTAAETLVDLSRLDVSGKKRLEGYGPDDERARLRHAHSADSLPSISVLPRMHVPR